MVPVTGRVLDAEEKGAARRRILARLIQAWAVAAGAPFFLSGWWRASRASVDDQKLDVERGATAMTFEQTDVFVSGTGGYHTYRIPAVVVTPSGTLLAFCEGRKYSAADDGDIDLLLRRSFDGGKTWEDVQLLCDAGPHTAGNPAPVVDLETGKVVLVFCVNNDSVWVTESGDDGATWSPPREITSLSETARVDLVCDGALPRDPACERAALDSVRSHRRLARDLQRRPRADVEARRISRWGNQRIGGSGDGGRPGLHQLPQYPGERAHPPGVRL